MKNQSKDQKTNKNIQQSSSNSTKNINQPQVDNKQQKSQKQISFLRQQQRLQKQRIKQLYRQINIQKQKSQRLVKQHEDRQRRVYQKVYGQSRGNVYQQKVIQRIDTEEYRQVPVDGQVYLGSRVYQVNCASCHTLETTTNKQDTAPALGLIYNRKVGTDLNYFHYSDIVLKKGFFWNSRNLYRFFTNPSQVLPRTKCGLVSKPLKQQGDRADLIVFMKEFSKQLQLNMRIQLIKSEGYQMYQTKLFAQKAKQQKIQRDIRGAV